MTLAVTKQTSSGVEETRRDVTPKSDSARKQPPSGPTAITTTDTPSGGPNSDKLMAAISVLRAEALGLQAVEADPKHQKSLTEALDALDVAEWGVAQGYATPKHSVVVRTGAYKMYKAAEKLVAEVKSPPPPPAPKAESALPSEAFIG